MDTKTEIKTKVLHWIQGNKKELNLKKGINRKSIILKKVDNDIIYMAKILHDNTLNVPGTKNLYHVDIFYTYKENKQIDNFTLIIK